MIDPNSIEQVIQTIKFVTLKQEKAIEAVPGIDVPCPDPQAQVDFFKTLYSDLRLIASLADGLANVISDPFLT